MANENTPLAPLKRGIRSHKHITFSSLRSESIKICDKRKHTPSPSQEGNSTP